MQEYSREKNDLEKQLKDLKERTTYHDDHLRIVDAWWAQVCVNITDETSKLTLLQLLDDLRLLFSDRHTNGTESNKSMPLVPAELFAAKLSDYEDHMTEKSSYIKDTLSLILQTIPLSNTTVNETINALQSRVSELSAAEKLHKLELERTREEKAKLEQRYAAVYTRSMIAEKKLDRAKSQTVAKIEKQAIHGGGNDAGSGLAGSEKSKSNNKDANGSVDHDVHLEVESARKEALAVTQKQKEQLDQLQSQNDGFLEQITTLNLRLSKISEDEVAKTDIFKTLKSQHEEVINKLNHLEATNGTLKEENEKLQSERTANRLQLEAEAKTSVAEIENALSRSETDLARIRAARDELAADVTIRKSCQDQEKVALSQAKELLIAGEQRIAALESELERLKPNTEPSTASNPDIESLDKDELRKRYEDLDRNYSMLNNELVSMGAAWKKAQAVASKKVMDVAMMEEKLGRLQAEKSKADQKYFSAMKAKDARDNEIRLMKAQNAKSADVVAQLKDVERTNSQLVANYEKSIVEFKASEASLSSQVRTAQQQTNEQKLLIDSLRAQIGDLTATLSEKDSSMSTLAKSCRVAETDRERLTVRLEETKKSLDMWKSKGSENEEYESLRVSRCSVYVLIVVIWKSRTNAFLFN
jgi:E3 ubiquitin-protein ligase BRE1